MCGLWRPCLLYRSCSRSPPTATFGILCSRTNTSTNQHVATCLYPLLNVCCATKAMIRRNPTIIEMNDMDVQDVRDLVDKQRTEAQARQALIQRMKRAAQGPLDEDGVSLMMQLKDAVNKQKEQERQRRLGMGNVAGEYYNCKRANTTSSLSRRIVQSEEISILAAQRYEYPQYTSITSLFSTCQPPPSLKKSKPDRRMPLGTLSTDRQSHAFMPL